MSDQDAQVSQVAGQPGLPSPPSQKYPALRVIATIYRVLAYLALVGGLIGVIVGLVMSGNSAPFSGQPAGGVGVIILSLIYSVVGFVTFLATSEIILVFIDIEANTRGNCILLRSLLERDTRR